MLKDADALRALAQLTSGVGVKEWVANPFWGAKNTNRREGS